MRISDWSSDVCSSDLPARQDGDVDRDACKHPLECRKMLASENFGGCQHRPLRARLHRVKQRHERHQRLARAHVPLKQAEHGLALRHVPSNLFFRLRFARSEEHTSDLQSLMRTSYAVLCLKKK